MSERKLYPRAFRRLLNYSAVLAATFVLTACSNDDMSDLKTYVSQVKARERSNIEPLPEIKTVETFVFDPTGLRNPFVPTDKPIESDQVAVDNGIRPDAIRSREELESYTLDSLRMVGTVNMQSTLWGLVLANDGTIHRIHTGNYAGKNHGEVIRIMEDQIELMEVIPDGPGSWREKRAEIKLSE